MCSKGHGGSNPPSRTNVHDGVELPGDRSGPRGRVRRTGRVSDWRAASLLTRRLRAPRVARCRLPDFLAAPRSGSCLAGHFLECPRFPRGYASDTGNTAGRTGCSSVWQSTRLGAAGSLVQVQSARPSRRGQVAKAGACKAPIPGSNPGGDSNAHPRLPAERGNAKDRPRRTAPQQSVPPVTVHGRIPATHDSRSSFPPQPGGASTARRP